ncbi:hypothetical protein [Ktedonospora formicarum]|uniref:Uncharacterized protein n=1 Tax=Ktedonospora formicarum TaxID=2778364 RepID=A0A8J3I2X9_9CHLR|nr:hypothetical protein [Ktedonospora formicarum]GHO48344.1 hypothetical protein KSX_65070 [Ktedonospora formicarum]
MAQIIRKSRTPAYCDVSAETLHYVLEGLLPPGQVLALNSTFGILTVLKTQGGLPQQGAMQQFTAAELGALLPLLTSYPHYCPYEVLMAGYYGNITEKTITYYRNILFDAVEKHEIDMVIRPVRRILSRIRFKLRKFDMTVNSIFETGYILRPTPLMQATLLQEHIS